MIRIFNFRVLGKQVLASEETGTEVIARPETKLNNALLTNNGNILEDIDDDSSNENLRLVICHDKKILMIQEMLE